MKVKMTPMSVGFALIAWLVASAIGFAILIDYEMTPGASGKLAQRFPSDVGISASHDCPTLIMFVHPRCPCTRAGIEELARITARSNRSINSHTIFFRPDTATDDWSQTDLWRAARRIPGLRLLIDCDGSLAKKFGAQTSGHVFLYDEVGVLRFEGGITPSRGHSGDNYGKAAILSLLGGGRPERDTTPVFGCPLDEPSHTTNTDCPACPTS